MNMLLRLLLQFKAWMMRIVCKIHGYLYYRNNRIGFEGTIRMLDTPWKINCWLQANVKYVKDRVDYWNNPIETYNNRYGDCLTGDTEIITIHDGKYRLIPIKELNNYKDIQVLSYDFQQQKFIPQNVTNFIKKDVRDVYRVTLRNGTSFKCTEDHKLFVTKYNWKLSQKKDVIRVVPLSKIIEDRKKLDRNAFHTLVCAREIPSLNNNPTLTNEELWVTGNYVAEGWSESSRACIAGDNPILQTILHGFLRKLGVSFRQSKREKSAYTSIHKSPFQHNLRDNFGKNAMDKHFPNEYLSLSKKQLEWLLEGYTVGDSYVFPENSERHCKLIHNTCSDILAKQLCFIHLILGRPLYSLYQREHQGFGKHPIWRLYEFPKSFFNRPINPNTNISQVTIKNIEPVGKEEVYDITVANNHNFVLSNSVIVHNCDDYARFAQYCLNRHGYQSFFLLMWGKSKGHATALFKEGLSGYYTLGTYGLVPHNTEDIDMVVSFFFGNMTEWVLLDEELKPVEK